ncbi:MAG: hypothetical protein RLZZ156_1994 [Deinococcota bacterium]|jgi:hypothetical protein
MLNLLTITPTTMNPVSLAALDITRALFLEVQQRLQVQHVAVLVRDTSQTLWTHHASGWFTHLRSHGVPEGMGLSWLTLNAKTLQVFSNPSQHPSVFSPEPNDQSKLIQVSVPFLGSLQQPLGVLHILRHPTQPFQKSDLLWLTQQSQAITVPLESALQTEDQLRHVLTDHPTARFIRDFALYLGEPLPIAQAVAWAVMLPKTTSMPNHLPLETRLALEQQQCRFDGTGTPALLGSQISISARIVQVVLAYTKYLEQGLMVADALAALRREAGWELYQIKVYTLV